MPDVDQKSKAPTFVHWIAVVLLFLMIAQPSVDNVRALTTGAFVMGEMSVDVTFTNVIFHIIGTVMGWVGFVWFYKRQKRGAYLTIAAHLVGLGAALIQLPEMLFSVMPPVAIAIFFVILALVALGPIFAFKEEYA